MATYKSTKLFQLLLVAYLALPGLTSPCGDVFMGVLLPFHHTSELNSACYGTLAAIELAVNTVTQPGGLLGQCNVVVTARDTNCSEIIGPLMAVDMYANKSADVFMGPSCDYALAPVAKYASAGWNIPILSANAWISVFDNKERYGLLTRMSGTVYAPSLFIHRILDRHGYKRHHLIFGTPKGSRRSMDFYLSEALFMEGTLRGGKQKPAYNRITEPFDLAQCKDALKALSKGPRVAIVNGPTDLVRNIMLAADELGLTAGSHVFITVELFGSQEELEKPWYRTSSNATENEKAKKAYEALFIVTLTRPHTQEYRRFSSSVKKRTMEKFPQSECLLGSEEVNIFVGAYHDAVILYALALNETLAAGGTKHNGTAVTGRMWNRTFQGVTGNVTIDTRGARMVELTLLDMDPNTGKFQTVATFDSGTKQYETIPGKSIHWPGTGKPPPPCDSQESPCQESTDARDQDSSGGSKKTPSIIWILAVLFTTVNCKHY